MGTPTPETPTKVFPEHPDDARQGVVRNYASCQSHCCLRHGCKYGYAGCPVVTGQATQDHPCEHCTEVLEARWDDDSGPAQPGEIGFQIVFAAKRTEVTEVTEGEPMGSMPTDEEVATDVAAHLEGLDLGHGWTIARVLTP